MGLRVQEYTTCALTENEDTLLILLPKHTIVLMIGPPRRDTLPGKTPHTFEQWAVTPYFPTATLQIAISIGSTNFRVGHGVYHRGEG